MRRFALLMFFLLATAKAEAQDISGPATVAPGAQFQVKFSNPNTHSVFDYAEIPTFEWQYLNGLHNPPSTPITSGTLTFTAPTTPGTYQVRMFSSGGGSEFVIGSFNFTVGTVLLPPPPGDKLNCVLAGRTLVCEIPLGVSRGTYEFPVGFTLRVPGTAMTYSDGLHVWAGNPFCNQGFLLQPTSPAIDAGEPIPGFHCSHSGPCLDEGRQEWYGKGPDAGACEFVS